jgi:putative protease
MDSGRCPRRLATLRDERHHGTMTLANVSTTRPELLAPAGDRECLIAAIENGADAVYFGLHGHNARARAANFDRDELSEVMALLRRRGVRGYVTLNTLVFPAELESVETIVRQLVEAGADALIVQDLGLCRLIRAISPDIEIHASTQMSVTSAEGIRLAEELGCSRVILARELSLKEIGRVRADSPLPVEVFVHGALCVAYSGQCLTSEALGGRSANRGECAQACRMPYQIVCDGRDVDLGATQYLLSPQDLAAFDLVPKLIELGVASLKIEGRLKSPEYVANITSHYRKAIDEALAGRPAAFAPEDVRDMEMSFSRGFSHGFLDGNNHKVLVRGDYAKKRGVRIGHVVAVVGEAVRIEAEAPIRPGDGVVFDGDDAAGVPEQGGRVYEVRPGRGGRLVELGFGRRDIDARRLRPGQRVWKTDDPELTRRLRASFEGPPHRLVDLDVRVEAHVGQPLRLEGRTATDRVAAVAAEGPLAAAERHPTTSEVLREQVDRLGGTVYRLRGFEAEIQGGPMVPKSVLNGLRRELVARLDIAARALPRRRIEAGPILSRVRRELGLPERAVAAHRDDQAIPTLSALCRWPEQVPAVLEAGVRTVYLDYQDPKVASPSVETIHRLVPDAVVFVATPRIEKPGEANLFRFLVKSGADGLLVRNAGGLAFCATEGIPFVADFSLNAANELTVGLLSQRGALRVTASYDLSSEQLDDLLEAVPPGWVEVVIHQHMPMFHMEHCVFCAFLSPGTDPTNCGRPCDDHDVRLRDRVGMEHPLKADVGCRNTLFNAVPQTAAGFLDGIVARGARYLRVEFLDDPPEIVARTLFLYREALEGRRDPRTLWKELKATNRYGVTRGQLAVLQA